MYNLNHLSKTGNEYVKQIPQNLQKGLELGISDLADVASGAITTKSLANAVSDNKDKGWAKRILLGLRDGGTALAGSEISRKGYQALRDHVGGEGVGYDLGEGIASLAGGDLAVRGLHKGIKQLGPDKTAEEFEVVGDPDEVQAALESILEGNEEATKEYQDIQNRKLENSIHTGIPGAIVGAQIYNDSNPYRGAVRGLFDGAAAYAGGDIGKNIAKSFTDKPLYTNSALVAGALGGAEASRRYIRPTIEKGVNHSMNQIKELYNESKEASSAGRRAGVGAGVAAAGYNTYDAGKNFDINDPKKSLKRTGKNLAGTAAGAIAGGVIGRNISGGSQSATKAGVGIGSLIGATQTSKLQDKMKNKSKKRSRPDFNSK